MEVSDAAPLPGQLLHPNIDVASLFPYLCLSLEMQRDGGEQAAKTSNFLWRSVCISTNTSKGWSGEMLDRKVNLVILAKYTTRLFFYLSLSDIKYLCIWQIFYQNVKVFLLSLILFKDIHLLPFLVFWCPLFSKGCFIQRIKWEIVKVDRPDFKFWPCHLLITVTL